MSIRDHHLETAAPSPIFPAPAYEELVKRFRPIFARIADDSVRREQTRELPFEPVRWLREAGFGAVRIPAEYSGGGATLPQLFRLLIELGEADSNLPQILRAHFAFVEGRLMHLDRHAQEFWLPKVVEGTLFGAAMAERTEATGGTASITREGDHWILDGTKYYSTGTLFADWIAAAALDGEDRISIAFPANLGGVARDDDWDGFGQRLTGSGTTKFNRVRLAEEHILRRFSEGGDGFDSYIKAFYQLVLLATLAGIGRASLRDSIAFVRGRTRTFAIPGTSSPRADPLVQRVVGRISSLSFAADSIVESAATVLQDAYHARLLGNADESSYIQAEINAFQAQQIVINLVLEATTLLFEVGGASATSVTRSFDRHWRNARTVASHNPAIHRERALGDYFLNGEKPDAAWRALREKLTKAENQSNTTDSSPTPQTESIEILPTGDPGRANASQTKTED
jgi:alkylation response protein AidB-like acyl-CoA dehydrogenase